MAEKTETLSKPAPAPAAKDRRSTPRYKFSAPAEVIDQKSKAKIESRVSDLGQLGCFFDSPNPFPLGTIVTLNIKKGTKSLEAIARVASSAVGKGMGLFFTTINPKAQETLAEWLSSSLETSWLASTRRRSQRILVKIPIRVMGKNNSGVAFQEDTYTQAASAHGALLLLSATVKKGQQLTMSNERTKASLECVVAHIGELQDGMIQIGVAFTLPNPGFWNATFPPEDWSVRHPDAKSDANARAKRNERA